LISVGEPVNGQELLAEFMRYGRQRPFEEITRRYAGMVYNVCLRVTKDKHDAEDATQAVFLTLALQAKRGVEIKALGPWLQQVAKRLSLDMRRSKKRRKTREERHHTEQTLRRNSNGHSLPPADLEEVKTILHEELHKLPSKYRMPLILHYFGGMTRDEMAVELGCKASTLGVRIFRGREMLAGRLNGRGVNLSLATFSAMMAYTIKSTVSHAMVASTSHAAMALMSGHEGVVSAQVIGLTRRAAEAVALGKLKVAAVILILAGTSLGAGARALGMLPAIDLGRIISDQIHNLIRPMTEPLRIPLRAEATPKPATGTNDDASVVMASAMQVDTEPYVVVERPASASNEGFILPAVNGSSGGPLKIVAATPAPWLSNGSDWGAAVSTQGAENSDSSTPANGSMVARNADDVESLPTASSRGASSDSASAEGGWAGRKANIVDAKSSSTAGGATGPTMAASAADDLSVGPSSGAGGSAPEGAVYALALQPNVSGNAIMNSAVATADSTPSGAAGPASAAAAKVVRIPAGNGNVTLSNGVLRGWGKINRTGTLDVSGKVVADGGGVDRTLDLSSFQTVCSDVQNSSLGGTNGWYARDHGRLVLPLKAAANGSSLTWGEDPNQPVLSLVNSVRLIPKGSDDPPTQLSLLAIDRQDVPSLTGLDGLPIGLWKVDAAGVSSALVSVRYDDVLVDSLGISESAVQLWTYGDGDWLTVAPATFALDTADHLVSGSASDFSYFAVAVPWNGDVEQMIATAGNERAPSVPEPTGLIVLALAGELLVRRRRG
jgi:RNA polymerase sigma factor (sigma-70 family)